MNIFQEKNQREKFFFSNLSEFTILKKGLIFVKRYSQLNTRSPQILVFESLYLWKHSSILALSLKSTQHVLCNKCCKYKINQNVVLDISKSIENHLYSEIEISQKRIKPNLKTFDAKNRIKFFFFYKLKLFGHIKIYINNSSILSKFEFFLQESIFMSKNV